jgi:hypothetical protein
MTTISYPYLPAGAHQPDGEHLQLDGHLIHFGEPMHSAASEMRSIYTMMTTEPGQSRRIRGRARQHRRHKPQPIRRRAETVDESSGRCPERSGSPRRYRPAYS